MRVDGRWGINVDCEKEGSLCPGAPWLPELGDATCTASTTTATIITRYAYCKAIQPRRRHCDAVTAARIPQHTLSRTRIMRTPSLMSCASTCSRAPGLDLAWSVFGNDLNCPSLPSGSPLSSSPRSAPAQRQVGCDPPIAPIDAPSEHPKHICKHARAASLIANPSQPVYWACVTAVSVSSMRYHGLSSPSRGVYSPTVRESFWASRCYTKCSSLCAENKRLGKGVWRGVS